MQAKEWYQRLNKPGWAPDQSVFAQIWTPLYIIIVWVNILIVWAVTHHRLSWKQAVPFWLNLVLNLLYSPVQFTLHNNILSLLIIISVLVTLVRCLAIAYSFNRIVFVLYLPYFLWVCVATVLQFQITILN